MPSTPSLPVDFLDLAVFVEGHGAFAQLGCERGADVERLADQVHCSGIGEHGQGAARRSAAVAHDRHLGPLVEVAVALDTVAHPPAEQFLLTRHPQPLARRSGGDDHGAGADGASALQRDLEATSVRRHRENVLIQELGPESRRLLTAGLDDVLPGRVEHAAVVFDVVVEDAASALLAEDEHGHLLARGVDGRLEPGRTGAEDDDIVFVYLRHELFSFPG